jgi:hypothetical protein
MKYGVFVFGVMAGLLTCTSVAETAGNARWIGVWQGVVHMTVTLGANEKVLLRCPDCGPDSPVTELVKAQ